MAAGTGKVDKEVLKTAHYSRDQFKHHAKTAVDKFVKRVEVAVGAADNLEERMLFEAEGEVEVAQSNLDKFSQAVVKCHVLGGLTEEEVEAYENTDLEQELCSDFEDASVTLKDLRCGFNARQPPAAQHQPVPMLSLVPKPHKVPKLMQSPHLHWTRT